MQGQSGITLILDRLRPSKRLTSTSAMSVCSSARRHLKHSLSISRSPDLGKGFEVIIKCVAMYLSFGVGFWLGMTGRYIFLYRAPL